MLTSSNKIKPLPAGWYFGGLMILTIGGILVSGYLAVSHYRVYTDIGYSSFCAVSKAINCDTVSQSPYSIFLDIPVPVWGIFGYLFFLITLVFAFNIKERCFSMLSVLFAVSLLYSATSILLALISTFKIHSYCIMCIVTYGINFLISFLVWLVRQRFEKMPWHTLFKKDFNFLMCHKKKFFQTYSVLLIPVFILMLFIPDYWHIRHTGQDPRLMNTGITKDGSPWIGAAEPELTIMEYTDYMCFQCKKMHFFLRRLMESNPEKIRLIHKHFPMDKKFNHSLKENLHPGSGTLASIAIYAMQKDKFWQVNDYLYNYNIDNKAIYLRKIAKDTGLDLDGLRTGIHSPKVRIELQRNIVFGLKKNISGTPTYIIGDHMYLGQIPAEILKSITK